MLAFLARPAAWAFSVRILPEKTRNLQEKSQSSWLDDRAVEYCMVLGDTRLVVREVQLDIVHRNVRAGRNENKIAMVPTRQNVLVVSAAAVVAVAVVAADAFAVAAVAWGAVKPIVAVAREAVKPIVAVAREAVKPIAVVAREAVKPIVVDDDVDDLFRRVYRERCHGLHDPVEPRRRAPDRRHAALHLWPGHGPRRHLRSSSSSHRPESGLTPVHQGQCLSSTETYFCQHRIQRGGHSKYDG